MSRLVLPTQRKNITLARRCNRTLVALEVQFPYLCSSLFFSHAGNAGIECADDAASLGTRGLISENNVRSHLAQGFPVRTLFLGCGTARSYDCCWRMFSSCPDGYSLVCGLHGQFPEAPCLCLGHRLPRLRAGRSEVSTRRPYQQSGCEEAPCAGRRFQRSSAHQLGQVRASCR